MRNNIFYTRIIFVISLIIFTFTSTVNFAQDNSNNDQQEKYSQVRIFAKTKQDMQRMQQQGLIIDHGIRKPGYYIESWLSESELAMLNRSNISYEIMIEDWDEYERSLPQMTDAEILQALQESYDDYNVSHSIYGTMRNRGFLKYSEAINKLDSMRIEYPNLISQKFSIGLSIQNRELWAVRISNSPNAPTGRPEIWLTALHHAREPQGMQTLIYFMYWLFENYNVDPIATYILNNRELYVTPFINPDGYVYNETGNGMWRKNRRNNGGSYGVDPNRNYGIYQFWNYPNNGSSTNPSSSTYRGTAPFSEPENQAVRDFANSRNLKTALHYHTYSNLLIRPWGCFGTETPDSNIFKEHSADMTQFNHYTTGIAQSLLYAVRGTSDDWHYHDSGHVKIFNMTPEVGTTGFWPTQAEIIPLAQENVWMNIYYCMVAGAFVYPNLAQFNQPIYNPGNSGNLRVLFKNKGLDAAQNVKIEWTSQSSYINIPTSVYSYPNLNSFDSDSSIFNFSIAGTVPNNSAIPTKLKFKQRDTNLVHSEDLYVLVGTGITTFADSAENGFGNWTTNQGWAITTSQYHSPTHSFTDSPFGNYQNNANNSMTLSTPINISSYPVVYLTFWHKYNTEVGYDFCNVEVSSDNGNTWQKVSSYDGVQSAWTQEVYNITSYANASSQLKIRFNLKSDVYITRDGWYVDDIKLTSYANVLSNIEPYINAPLKYSLSQNYPNPFNPSTVIEYSIAKQGNVTIKIFDMLGRDIMTLVNEDKTRGNYSIVFNGKNLPSGIYYYRIKSGNYVDTKKMILLK